MSREIKFKYWDEITEGDTITRVEMDVPFERVI